MGDLGGLSEKVTWELMRTQPQEDLGKGEQVANARVLSQEQVWLGLRNPQGIWSARNK